MSAIPLSQLRGEDIATACNALPPCRADSPERMTGSVETPWHGLVLITFTKMRHQFHKTRRWYLLAESAETLTHVCDRKGPSTKVIDETGDEPITAIYGSCSVCGKPQVFG